MNNKIEIGNCYSIETKFPIYLLNSNFTIWKSEKIKNGEKEIFVVLGELALNIQAAAHALTTATAAAACRLRHATQRAADSATAAAFVAAAAAPSTRAWDIYDKIYKNALKEAKETGEIKGYEIYLANLNEKVWIGKNDFQNLLKVICHV